MFGEQFLQNSNTCILVKLILNMIIKINIVNRTFHMFSFIEFLSLIFKLA